MQKKYNHIFEWLSLAIKIITSILIIFIITIIYTDYISKNNSNKEGMRGLSKTSISANFPGISLAQIKSPNFSDEIDRGQSNINISQEQQQQQQQREQQQQQQQQRQQRERQQRERQERRQQQQRQEQQSNKEDIMEFIIKIIAPISSKIKFQDD